MKATINVLTLAGLWVTTVILLGALGRITWFLLQVGWGLLP